MVNHYAPKCPVKIWDYGDCLKFISLFSPDNSFCLRYFVCLLSDIHVMFPGSIFCLTYFVCLISGV